MTPATGAPVSSSSAVAGGVAGGGGVANPTLLDPLVGCTRPAAASLNGLKLSSDRRLFKIDRRGYRAVPEPEPEAALPPTAPAAPLAADPEADGTPRSKSSKSSSVLPPIVSQTYKSPFLYKDTIL